MTVSIKETSLVRLDRDLPPFPINPPTVKMPIFMPSPVDPVYSNKLVFEGIGVDLHEDGAQGNMDATLAFKTAARNCIAYLMKLGYTREQAYLLLSACPVDSHIGAVVE